MRRAKTLLISILFLALVASSCGSDTNPSPETDVGAGPGGADDVSTADGAAESGDGDTASEDFDDTETALPEPTTTEPLVTTAAPATTAAPGQGGVHAEALVLAAFTASSSVESTRITMTIEAGGMPDMGPEPMLLSVDVAVSGDGSRSQMAMDFSSMIDTMPPDEVEADGPLLLMFAQPFEVRSAEGTTYMSSGFFGGLAPFFGIPTIETPWVGFADDGSFGEDFNFEQSQFSAEQLLLVLRGMGESAEIVDTETIDGVTTTHVRGSFSPESLAAANVDWDVSELDMTGMMDFGVEIFEIDVWIDESDHVRRLVFGVSDLAAIDPTAPEGAFFRFQVDLGDSSEPVVIDIPSESDVTWLDDLAG